jgi:hypothetical protein
MRGLLTVGGLMLLACSAWADPLDPIPADVIARIGPLLVESAAKQDDAPFKVDADIEKATGLFREGVGGLMIVPVKNFKADGLTGAQEANGAPAGYFFLYKLSPVVDGKPLESGKLATITHKDDNGNEREIAALRIALKKESDKDWKLLVFGKDKKPIFTAPFKEQANGSDQPVSLSAKETGNDQGTLTITVFGKYAADVPLAKLQ